MFLTTDNENKTADGYVALFATTNSTRIAFHKNVLLLDTQKFIIGLWLGVSSLTVALILHVGRCSVKTANALNKVVEDVTEAANAVVDFPKVVTKLTKVAAKTPEVDDKKQANKSSNFLEQEQNESTEAETSFAGRKSTVPIGNDVNQQEMSDLVNNQTQLTSTEQQTTEVIMPDPQTRKDLEIEHEFDHAFAHFAKGIRKVSTTSIILLIAFIIYDVYTYVRHARKYSYDWFILFPFPFWFSLVLFVNICTFIITEIVFNCQKKVQGDSRKVHSHSFQHGKAFTIMINFFTTISATTLPIFLLFHMFWLLMASSLFAVRLASSALFYIPLVIFVFWFLAITSWIMRVWKKIIKKEIHKQTDVGLCKRILKVIPHFLRPLIPFLFLPFWCLLLATLRIFSSFLNTVVDIEDYSFLGVLTVIAVTIGVTKKIADNCKPKVNHNDDE